MKCISTTANYEKNIKTYGQRQVKIISNYELNINADDNYNTIDKTIANDTECFINISGNFTEEILEKVTAIGVNSYEWDETNNCIAIEIAQGTSNVLIMIGNTANQVWSADDIEFFDL